MNGHKPATQVFSYAIDDVALASLRDDPGEKNAAKLRCNLCDRPIKGRPTATGLLLWSRGEELHVDEPPLCPNCAATISVTALASWQFEDEGR